MFDTLAVAQQLAGGGVAREQAEVIAKAIHDGLEQGEHVTADQFANLRTEQKTGNRRRADRDREPGDQAYPVDGRNLTVGILRLLG